MKKAFAARRVPRKIGQDEEDENNSSTSNATSAQDSALRRPTNKPRKSSSLRTSIGPSAVEDDDDSEASVVTPKRSNISRIAIQRNASKRSSLLVSQLPVRQAEEDDEERPSYSAANLRALKESTPSTPQEFSSAANTELEDVATGTRDLDLSSKFGSSLARYEQSAQASAIPSAGEIAEKKARRARMAKEQAAEEYISLDPDDPDLDDEDLDENVMRDEAGRLVLKPKDKYGHSESRLVRDDEDIMEDFDDFTEDGRIALGRKAELEAARRKKQEMAAQIAEAEGASNSESDDSDRERNEAYEAAQTRHGTYGQAASWDADKNARPEPPPTITPIPTLDGAIEKLRKRLADMQTSRMQKLKEMEALQREKLRLAEEEVRIQRALKDTADKFEELRKERGINGVKPIGTPKLELEAPSILQAQSGDNDGDAQMSVDGGTAENAGDARSDEYPEESAAGQPGLGFSMSSRGRSGLGLGAQLVEDSVDDM
ncbi:hypothetical protein TI39_contig4208g00007 [Zymoseptoria brevis]|uniref:Nineteen complex-related protein 2 domain-containing protein n=1 Tax=Zymoseptoria brevis TaxID=1047168 RepID=A0A0F4GA07_9PEZI|nr:hypothetical protein TI39_contig4208g00007 [Zymoseptoria brevis]